MGEIVNRMESDGTVNKSLKKDISRRKDLFVAATTLCVNTKQRKTKLRKSPTGSGLFRFESKC